MSTNEQKSIYQNGLDLEYRPPAQVVIFPNPNWVVKKN